MNLKKEIETLEVRTGVTGNNALPLMDYRWTGAAPDQDGPAYQLPATDRRGPVFIPREQGEDVTAYQQRSLALAQVAARGIGTRPLPRLEVRP
jgi:hypothetical protein